MLAQHFLIWGCTFCKTQTARAPIEWFRSNHIHVLEWSGKNLDLSPIQDQWQDLKTTNFSDGSR